MKLYFDQAKGKVRNLPDPEHEDLQHLMAYALSRNEEKAYIEYIKPIIDRGVNKDDVLTWLKAVALSLILEDAKMNEFIEFVKKEYTIY